jgi:hypothetical protein
VLWDFDSVRRCSATGVHSLFSLHLACRICDAMTDYPKRIANLFNVTPELLREFLAHLSKADDETVTLYADGRAVEIPVV